MTVRSSGNDTVLTCGTCKTARMSISKRDVTKGEWADTKGWKDLRARAWRAGWRVSASANGDHYCPKCIKEYDF